MIKNYLRYIGLINASAAPPTNIQQYTPSTNLPVAEKYLQYLKELDTYQKERRNTIEAKNSQLVGQASIVASVFALFVPLLLDSFESVSFWIKIPLSIMFLFVLCHYLLAIFHATKTLKINRYRYSTRGSTTVTKITRATSDIDFVNEEIKDLNYMVNQNAPLDNIKGDNLIFGARNFEVANFGFGCMAVLIIICAFVVEKSPEEIKITNKNIPIYLTDTLNTGQIDVHSTDTILINVKCTDCKSIKKPLCKNHRNK